MFSATRNFYYDDSFEVSNGTIKFNSMVMNIGDTFDPQSGVFRAPKMGAYSFSFSGTTRYLNSSFSVEVMVNDDIALTIQDDANHQGVHHNNVSFNWHLALKANDKVKLIITDGSMDVNSILKIVFSGSLVYAP